MKKKGYVTGFVRALTADEVMLGVYAQEDTIGASVATAVLAHDCHWDLCNGEYAGSCCIVLYVLSHLTPLFV